MTVVKMRLNDSSMEKAIKKLIEYRNKKLPAKIDKIAEGAVKAFIREARARYGSDAKHIVFTTSSMSTQDKKVWTITVSSPGLYTKEGEARPIVVFLEFGTGTPADTPHKGGYDANVPFDVYAGSWSEHHDHTYEAWQNLRGFADSNGEYIFNTKPVAAIYHGMQAARKYVSKYTTGSDEP